MDIPFKKVKDRKAVVIHLEPEIVEALDKRIKEDKLKALEDSTKRNKPDYYTRVWSRTGYIRRLLIKKLDLKIVAKLSEVNPS